MLAISSFPQCSTFVPHRRSMSFNASSSCLPSKLSRSASPLRRTGSYLSLTELSGGSSQPATNSCASVRRFIEHQEKRFKQSHGLTITSHKPSSVLAASKSCSGAHRQRTSSPLSPVPHLLPPRPSFPRSKPEPDLYKVAIITRMRTSHPGGQKVSISVLSATKDLETMVAGSQKDDDSTTTIDDVDESSNNSWYTLASDDREMTR